jgi:cobalamin biosynthesis protein CbiG
VSRGLVVGVGCSLGCSSEELATLVQATLGALVGAPAAVATIDGRATEPCVTALAENLGVPLRTYPAEELAAVLVPTPSLAVEQHVGTPSVAEAAALLASQGELVVTKRRSQHATCAVARDLSWRA